MGQYWFCLFLCNIVTCTLLSPVKKNLKDNLVDGWVNFGIEVLKQ